ncbi:SCO family protein [Lentisalinibacter salinarum]|uniref:SCO family protein n=1 Tax=Lentisalinibacter salinarum TaxID=2992239 RepID=UPI0038677A22
MQNVVCGFSALLTGGIFLVMSASLLADGSLPEFDRVRVLESAPQIGEAELTDQDGESVRLSDLRGKLALVFFGFTNCRNVCPMAMEKLRRLERSGQLVPEDVAYILISVDGERDTPEVMKEFLSTYSPRFIGLTGKPEYVRGIAKEFSAAFFKGHKDKSGDYQVMHSPQIFLVDPDGRLRAELHDASIEAMVETSLAVLNEDRGP